MTTGWKKLTRKDLATFDTFATNAVLTAMELGGIGRIGTNGHARIRGEGRETMTVARDTSAPHCQGNVQADLKRAFPQLRTNGVTKEEVTVSTKPTTDTATRTTTEMLDCPAKGCEERFSSMNRLREHIKESEHAVCKEEGCDYGPNGGPYISLTWHGVAGHTNVRHKGNQPWLQNQAKAAVKRAATVKAKREAREAAELSPVAEVMSNGQMSPVAEVMSNGHLPTATIETAPADIELATNPMADMKTPAVPSASDAETKLALIQEILGENPEVARLQKELADVKAHLALVREAVGLDFGDDS